MAGSPTFALHISLTVSPKSVYLNLAELLLENISQMPDIDSLLATDEANVREMQKLFAGYQGLPELLNTASILYTTCSRALGQALSHEVNSLPRDTSPDSPIVAEVVVKWQRGLLFARIGTLYATAV